MVVSYSVYELNEVLYLEYYRLDTGTVYQESFKEENQIRESFIQYTVFLVENDIFLLMWF